MKKLSSKKMELSGTYMELIHDVFKKHTEESIALQYILHKEYNIPKSTLSRVLRGLEQEGEIKSLPNCKPKFYYLVGHKVPHFVTRGQKSSHYRLHNIELSFNILKHSKTPLREQWKLSNWIGSKERFGDVTARFTTKNLILYLQGYGRSQAEALGVTMYKANKIIDEIKLKHPDLVINPIPDVNRKMHYALPTPQGIKDIAKQVQVSGEGWKIDESEGEGELEYVSKDPFELIEKAESFANIPEKIKSLEQIDMSLMKAIETQQKEILSLHNITRTLQESLMNIVSPFQQPSDRPNTQKTLDLFKEKREEIKYIG